MLLATRNRVLALRQSAAKESRRIVAQVLATWEPDVDLRAVESCTSELVTDALRNGDCPLHLVIQHWTDCVRVTVIKSSAKRGDEFDPAPYGESWVRQRIVDGLATRHGVEALPAGSAAWVDVDTNPISTHLDLWR